jgi:hypothetical protein
MSKPTKEQLREWQRRNREEKRPPVTPEDARRELGWDLIPTNDPKKNKNSRCNPNLERI